jgi:hypothetical protein
MRWLCRCFLVGVFFACGIPSDAKSQSYCSPRNKAEKEVFLAASLVWAGYVNGDIDERNPAAIKSGQKVVMDRDKRGYTGPFDDRDYQHVCKKADMARQNAGLENYTDDSVYKVSLPKAIVPITVPQSRHENFVTRRSVNGEVLLTIGSRPIKGDAQSDFWAFYGDAQQKYMREYQNPRTPSTQAPFTKFHFEGYEKALPTSTSTKSRKVYLSAVWQESTLRYMKFSFPATPENIKLYEPIANAVFPSYLPFARAAQAAKTPQTAPLPPEAKSPSIVDKSTASAISKAIQETANAKAKADLATEVANKSAVEAKAKAAIAAEEAKKSVKEANTKAAIAEKLASEAKHNADAAVAAAKKFSTDAKTAADQLSALCPKPVGAGERLFHVASNRAVRRPGVAWTNERAETLSFASAHAFPQGRRKAVFEWSIPLATSDQFKFAVSCDINKGSEHETLLLFIHGSNNTFDQAVTAFSDFSLSFNATAILFSWPAYSFGKDLLRNYQGNLVNAENSRGHLKTFLLDIKEFKYRKLVVIAHSMGSSVLLTALKELALSGDLPSLRLEQVVFSAPDVDTTLFRDDWKEIGKSGSLNTTLYASNNDVPLLAAKWLRENKSRAGVVGNEASWKDLTSIPGLVVIDVSGLKPTGALAETVWGHSHHIIDYVQMHIAKLVAHGGAPERQLDKLADERKDLDLKKVGGTNQHWIASRKPL